MYYGSAEKGYTPLHKSKNILTRKDDEDFWSLAIVQKLNCDSETIIIFFLRFSIFQFFNGGEHLKRLAKRLAEAEIGQKIRDLRLGFGKN